MQTLRSPMKRAHLALLSIIALVLTACGAAVNTTLSIDDNLSGSRTMVMEIGTSDSESTSLKGGLPAVDESIKRHLPAELEYSGISTDDKGSRATFTLKFSSVDDYQTKVESLLKSSGKDLEPTIVINLADTGLVTGTTVQENFTSAQLLGWLGDALKADGVYSDGNIFSGTEETIVHVGGKDHKTNSTIKVSDVTDNGVPSLGVQLIFEDDGTYTGRVAFGSTTPLGSVKQGYVDTYISENAPEGHTVSAIDNTTFAETNNLSTITHGQLVTFSATDINDFNTKLQKLLSSDQNAITLTDRPSETDKTLFTASIEAKITCPTVCSPAGNGPRFDAKVPSNWQKSYSGNIDSAEESTKISRTSILEYTYSLTFDAVDVNLDLNGDGGGEATFSYSLNADQANRVGDGLQDFLAPEGDGTSIDRSESDGMVTYTATIEGSDAQELTSRLSSYVPGARITKVEREGNWFSKKYDLYINLPFSTSDYDATLANGYSYTIDLPSQHSIPEESRAQIDASEVERSSVTFNSETSDYKKTELAINVKTPNWVGIILVGLLVLILLALIATAFLFRDRIKAAMDERKQQAPAQQPYAPQQAAPANPSYTSPQNPAPGNTDGDLS
ncbi:hypothetical protein [Rothia sp. 32237D007AR]